MIPSDIPCPSPVDRLTRSCIASCFHDAHRGGPRGGGVAIQRVGDAVRATSRAHRSICCRLRRGHLCAHSRKLSLPAAEGATQLGGGFFGLPLLRGLPRIPTPTPKRSGCLGGKPRSEKCFQTMTPVGLEPTIPGSVGRCLIH